MITQDTFDEPPTDIVESLRRKQAKICRFSVDELIELYPNDDPPLIDGLVRIGETMNVIASPKIGKTWLVAGMSYCIANGIEWMGYPTSQGKVHIFDCELRPATLRFRYQKVREAMQVDSTNVHITSLRGDGRSIMELAKDIEESFEPGEYSCIVWDALYRLLPPDTSENSNEDMARIYNELDRISQHTKATNIVIHHSSKGSQSDKAITDIGSGAGAISRSADTHLAIRPHELADCAVMEAVCRSFRSPDPMTIRWEFPLWHCSMIEPEVKQSKDGKSKAQEATDKETSQVIARALGSVWKTTSTLRSETGFGLPRVMRGLRLLNARSKKVKSQKTKKRVDAYAMPEESKP